MSDGSGRKLKAKKMGVLIRDARQKACTSVEECALALGITPESFQAFELGENSPSLPELEVLAYFLKIPIEHFWGDVLMDTGADQAQFDPQRLISLRQKIIGVLIRKYRTEKGMTLQALADRAGINAEKLYAMEQGDQPIPVYDLEILTLELGWPIKAFQDQQGPVGSWLLQQRYLKDFLDLSPEIQEFIGKPINHPYLDIARRMSEMPVDKLRNIAEVLLEITL
jgi:transcriptional regulator with XRE-family HTH domain